MVKGFENPGNEKVLEKGSRWLRNINALGAVAFGGVGLAVESTVLTAYGAFNAAQAAFFEMTRRWTSKNKASSFLGSKAVRVAHT